MKIIRNKPFSKKSFSCKGCPEIRDYLQLNQIRDILICGIETHICVQQTALELAEMEYKVYIPIDAVGSRNQIDHEISLKRVQSSGITLTTTESIFFEWCRTSDRSEFRAISKLAKESNKAKE